jgi:hypothetical protein
MNVCGKEKEPQNRSRNGLLPQKRNCEYGLSENPL